MHSKPPTHDTAPVTVRPELTPDQSKYDPADPELRAAAALLQEALNAESVQREEELWTQVIDRLAHPAPKPCLLLIRQLLRTNCLCQTRTLTSGQQRHGLLTTMCPPALRTRFGGLDRPWVPDVVGRAWGNRGNARSRQVKLAGVVHMCHALLLQAGPEAAVAGALVLPAALRLRASQSHPPTRDLAPRSPHSPAPPFPPGPPGGGAG
jgi:hypothetical protein